MVARRGGRGEAEGVGGLALGSHRSVPRVNLAKWQSSMQFGLQSDELSKYALSKFKKSIPVMCFFKSDKIDN